MDAEKFNEFWSDFAAAFAAPLQANGLLGRFVSNTAVTGAYAESWIGFLASSMLKPLRVSTGAVIRTSDRRSSKPDVPQCDIIVWDPTELPALFEQGNFALVHTQAARAIIEVKRSISSVSKHAEQLQKLQSRLLSEYKRNVLCVVVNHQSPLFVEAPTPDWMSNRPIQKGPAFTRLLSSEDNQPDCNGIFAFVYFLSHVARSSPPKTV